MLKVCVMTDNPHLRTGMARVGREIATGIYNMGHEVIYIGWYENPPKTHNLPFRVIDARQQFFGSDILDSVWRNEQFDVLITIGDNWRLDYIGDSKRCHTRRFFQWIAYTAIDGEAFGGGVPFYLRPTYNTPDRMIVYTNWAKEAVLKSMPEMQSYLGMIYHGVDHNLFKPVDEATRQKIRQKFGCGNRFMFLVVSRNQPRKNIPEIFKAWKLVSLDKEMDGATLWPHMHFNDPFGASIDQMIEVYGINTANKKNVMYIDAIAHAPREIDMPDDNFMFELYQMADCLVMAGSEGFGLPVLEAMACRKPVIALDHSATGELCADGRGFLVPVQFETTGAYMHEKPWPDYNVLYQTMKRVMKNKEERDKVAEEGYKFSQNHSWASKLLEWRDEIEKLEYPLSSPIELKEVV